MRPTKICPEPAEFAAPLNEVKEFRALFRRQPHGMELVKTSCLSGAVEGFRCIKDAPHTLPA